MRKKGGDIFDRLKKERVEEVAAIGNVAKQSPTEETSHPIESALRKRKGTLKTIAGRRKRKHTRRRR